MTTEPPRERAQRPLRVPWWLWIALLVLVAANTIEIVVTMSTNAVLDSLPLPFSPAARVIFAGTWVTVLLIYGVALWLQRRWAFRWIVPVLNLYALTHVVWQILFFRSDFDRGRLPFQIVIAALLVLPLWAIAWQRGWLTRSMTITAE